jgi:hypothetical protein
MSTFFEKKVRFDTLCFSIWCTGFESALGTSKGTPLEWGLVKAAGEGLSAARARLPHARETATTQHRDRQVRPRPDKAAVVAQEVSTGDYTTPARRRRQSRCKFARLPNRLNAIRGFCRIINPAEL